MESTSLNDSSVTKPVVMVTLHILIPYSYPRSTPVSHYGQFETIFLRALNKESANELSKELANEMVDGLVDEVTNHCHRLGGGVLKKNIFGI